MQTHPRKLIVVICEAALEKVLVEDAHRLGAAGYTIADVRGRGRGGTREGAWEADRSIEMKVIGDAGFAERFAAHVLAAYCEHYSVTMYLGDVSVLRPEKFGGR
jgi:nitrogen regulatory protein P-II 2